MAKPNRDTRKQFLFDKDTAARLKSVADLKEVSENEIVNRALSAYLKRFDNVVPADIEPMDITREVIKC